MSDLIYLELTACEHDPNATTTLPSEDCIESLAADLPADNWHATSEFDPQLAAYEARWGGFGWVP
jgi:hypothetical protein